MTDPSKQKIIAALENFIAWIAAGEEPCAIHVHFVRHVENTCEHHVTNWDCSEAAKKDLVPYVPAVVGGQLVASPAEIPEGPVDPLPPTPGAQGVRCETTPQILAVIDALAPTTLAVLHAGDVVLAGISDSEESRAAIETILVWARDHAPQTAPLGSCYRADGTLDNVQAAFFLGAAFITSVKCAAELQRVLTKTQESGSSMDQSEGPAPTEELSPTSDGRTH